MIEKAGLEIAFVESAPKRRQKLVTNCHPARCFAELETNLHKECQLEGITKAKAEIARVGLRKFRKGNAYHHEPDVKK
jgi:hypothetical protein